MKSVASTAFLRKSLVASAVRGSWRWVLYDRHGRMVVSATMYFDHLRSIGMSDETVDVKVRVIADFYKLAGLAKGGEGVGLEDFDDQYMAIWHSHLTSDATDRYGRITGARGIRQSTFNDYMGHMLAFFQFAQEHGYAHKLIGTAGTRSRVTVKQTGRGMRHVLQKGAKRLKKPYLPTTGTLDNIEAVHLAAVKSPNVRYRDQQLLRLLRRSAMRRKELAELKVDEVPSLKSLQALRGNDKQPLVPITIVGAKKGGKRTIHLPMEDVLDLRHFIDSVRPRLHPEGNFVREVFTSCKTGAALIPQSITNLVKRAAANALTDDEGAPPQLPASKVSPHVYRHKSLTDTAEFKLSRGEPADQVLLYIMDEAGHRDPEMSGHYIHIGKQRLQLKGGRTTDGHGPSLSDSSVRPSIFKTIRSVRYARRSNR